MARWFFVAVWILTGVLHLAAYALGLDPDGLSFATLFVAVAWITSRVDFR